MDVRLEKELAVARKQLHRLAGHWRLRLLRSAVIRSAGLAGACFGLTGFILEQQTLSRMAISGATFLLSCAGQILLLRKKSGDAHTLARHLNRVRPAMEESGELLLAAEDTLTPLARLQRRRILLSWPADFDNTLLPRQPVLAAWRFFAVTVFLALLAMVLQLRIPKQNRFQASPTSLPPVLSSTSQALPVEIKLATIAIAPPRYTGKPARRVSQFDLHVEEGAQITWQIVFNQPLQAAGLVLMNGDTLALHRISAQTFTAAERASESTLYHLWAVNPEGKAQLFEYHRIEVIKDLPPAIVMIHPEPRTEIDADQPTPVRLEAIIDDDYGVQHVELVATLARGSGEGVKFRESNLALDQIQKDSRRHWRANMRLDLPALGMRPGDELYFYLFAHDNREPQKQSSRSDTYFIVWQDTTSAELPESASLLINPIPEYFRSQRQIIIDTEKLLQDRSQLSEKDFERRSQNLGLDQQALRLRYGQFLGEESDKEADFNASAGTLATAHKDGEEQESPGAASQLFKDKTGADQIMKEFAHLHDLEENATLFAPSLKAQLQAALAEMWEAELHLRTHRPQQALPFEYRALALLKAVQQSSRAYVQRVGFEPPPIKIEENRLSGDLAKVAGGRWEKKTAGKQVLPEVREALAILENLQSQQTHSTAWRVAILERAGIELARLALAQPGRHLRALQDLRTLINAIKNDGEICASCVLAVQSALWQALPPVEPQPTPRPEAKTSLAQKYFMRLGNE